MGALEIIPKGDCVGCGACANICEAGAVRLEPDREHFDIGLVGWWHNGNFGSMLTYFALHQTLSGMGYSVLMIQEAIGYPHRGKSNDTSTPMQFGRKHYIYSRQRAYDELIVYNNICDMFICGSDQLWNPLIGRVNDDCYLDFVFDNKKKLSYATSFGNRIHNPQASLQEKRAAQLSRFDYLSVREDYAVEIAKKSYQVDAVQVLDPVFLPEMNEYEILAAQATVRITGNVLVAFILDPDQNKKRIIAKIAQMLHLEVFVVPDANETGLRNSREVFDGYKILDDLSPENLMYLYKNSTYVVTDSFHGSCFCYLFRKNFSVFFNERRGIDRFIYLHQLLGLERRRLHTTMTDQEIEQNEEIPHPVDFTEAEARVSRMREQSLDWLKEALASPVREKPAPLPAVKTWQDRENEEGFTFSIYEPRIKLLRKFITEQDKSVVDFGAGVMFLETLLPKEISYYPMDYIKRSEKTIVCNINKKEFPNIHADVAFISGFLEYVEDTDWFFYELAEYFSKIILSYSVCRQGTKEDIDRRKSRAWVSHLTQNALIFSMHKNGFLADVQSTLNVNQVFLVFLKATTETLRKNYFCSGCGACTNICPVNALTLTPDENGYYRPECNTEICVQCGQCVKKCPVLNPPENKNTKEPECYEFIAADEDLLFKSSSGGVFPLLAKKVLSEGGVVAGVSWRDDFTVAHILIDKEEDLYKLQKSKYLQSYVGDIHRQIKEKLEKGVKVLFSGVPCQAAALKNFLDKEYDNLFIVDLLCHYSPSSKFFIKYLKDTFGEDNVIKYEFRHKRDGWTADCLTFTLADGRTLVRRLNDDPYQRVFHNRTMISNACANCRFSLLPRYGDITLGDFHGINKLDNALDPNYKKGISVVLINTSKGKLFFNAISTAAQLLKEVPLKWVQENGRLFRNPADYTPPERDTFYAALKIMPFPGAVETCRGKK
jgi:coenzyme F420-reducing hydrogenase beta subunit